MSGDVRCLGRLATTQGARKGLGGGLFHFHVPCNIARVARLIRAVRTFEGPVSCVFHPHMILEITYIGSRIVTFAASITTLWFPINRVAQIMSSKWQRDWRFAGCL